MMYPKAGHGFFYYSRPNYRQEQAVDIDFVNEAQGPGPGLRSNSVRRRRKPWCRLSSMYWPRLRRADTWRTRPALSPVDAAIPMKPRRNSENIPVDDPAI